MLARTRTRGAFSLIELVIVVVIIGIIGAIAIPRMSRGSQGAAESSLKGNLAVLRSAIELYTAEHNGTVPTEAAINSQLTLYSDASGNTNASKTAVYIYGPYLQSVPALPVGAKKGGSTIAAADSSGVGWIYDDATSTIRANCTDSEVDSAGVKYNAY